MKLSIVHVHNLFNEHHKLISLIHRLAALNITILSWSIRIETSPSTVPTTIPIAVSPRVHYEESQNLPSASWWIWSSVTTSTKSATTAASERTAASTSTASIHAWYICSLGRDLYMNKLVVSELNSQKRTFSGRLWNVLSFRTKALLTRLGSENSTYAYLHALISVHQLFLPNSCQVADTL